MIDHKLWSTWKLIKGLFANGGSFLEIGAGNRPKTPIKGSYFIDLSKKAVNNLKKRGGFAKTADASNIPYDDNMFDVVCAFEILEHVENDKKAFDEILRVLKTNGKFVLSVPLGMKYWSSWDELVGHIRRYEPGELKEILQMIGFKIEKFLPTRSISVLQRYMWLGKIGTAIYKRVPKPFIFLEHHLVTKVVNLESRLGSIRGLCWETGEFANIGENKTGALLMCAKINKS